MATILIGEFAVSQARVPTGGTVAMSWKIRNAVTGVLAAPATAAKIRVVDPAGVEFLAITVVAATSTGSYDYGLSVPAGSKAGFYRVELTSTGDVQAFIDDRAFEVF